MIYAVKKVFYHAIVPTRSRINREENDPPAGDATINVRVSPVSRGLLKAMHAKYGVDQKAIVGRLLEWLFSQPEEVQRQLLTGGDAQRAIAATLFDSRTMAAIAALSADEFEREVGVLHPEAAAAVMRMMIDHMLGAFDVARLAAQRSKK